MPPITILTDTVHSDDGSIVKPPFLTIHFSGAVTTFLPSHVVSFSVNFHVFSQLMNVLAN